MKSLLCELITPGTKSKLNPDGDNLHKRSTFQVCPQMGSWPDSNYEAITKTEIMTIAKQYKFSAKIQRPKFQVHFFQFFFP